MTGTEVVIEGTLKSDGTLELDQKPNLAPGRVTVVLRSASSLPPPKEDWFQYLLRIRAEREAAGYRFMNEEEMQAHLQWLRDDEDRIDQIHREMDLEKRCQEQEKG